jgi:ribokinase
MQAKPMVNPTIKPTIKSIVNPIVNPIVVVGSINMDLVVAAERIPRPGETLRGTGFATHPGGKGANQAVAVARLEYPVAMVGMVGSDSFGEQLREELRHAGVDDAAVGTAPGASGVAVITVAASGENSIVVHAGANAAVTPEYLERHAALIAGAGMVLAQLEVPVSTIVRLAELCAAAGVPLMLDPAPACSLPRSLFEKVAWFTPNATEAAFYGSVAAFDGSAQEESAAVARALLERGAAGVILKLGREGAYLLDRKGNKGAIDPFAVQAVDTTAAGDAFNAAFAVATMRGETPFGSARFASAAAAVSVTRAGAQGSMPTCAEVETLLGNSILASAPIAAETLGVQSRL